MSRPPKIIDLNPGPKPIPVSSAARRLDVPHTAIVSAIHGGHVTGARKIAGIWHVEAGAVWTRHPVGGNRRKRAQKRSTPALSPKEGRSQ